MTLTSYTTTHATTPTLSGLITGMPESVYHARPEISKHDADLCWEAPIRYKEKHKLRTPASQAMIDGTILGAMLLGLPIDPFAVIIPDSAPRKPSSTQREAAKPSDKTLEAIAWWDRFNETIGDRQVITPRQHGDYCEIASAVAQNPEVSKLLSFAEASEVSMFWDCPHTGLKRRGRPDRIRAGNIVIDLKKTACADVRAFQRQIADYRYDVQAADYVDGLRAVTGEDYRFYWVCYEVEVPYLTACYEASDTTLQVGRARSRKAMEKIKQCIDTGIWGGYQTGIPQIDPPKWLMMEESVA